MSRLLRTDLPDDVWLRFQAEAQSRGMTIGRHLKTLIVTRDKRLHPEAHESGESGSLSRDLALFATGAALAYFGFIAVVRFIAG